MLLHNQSYMLFETLQMSYSLCFAIQKTLSIKFPLEEEVLRKKPFQEILWFWKASLRALSLLSKNARTPIGHHKNKGRRGWKISLSSRQSVSRVVWMAVSIQLALCFMAITAHHPSLVYRLLIMVDSTSCEFYLGPWPWCRVKT